MKLKKKLVSLLLSVGVIASTTSVNMFALNCNMDYSDFSLEVFKLNQSAEKFLYSSSNKSIDEKLRFLESEGFEQIETFLVNAPRFPGFMWKDLMINIRYEICSIRNQVKDIFKEDHNYARLDIICRMLCAASKYYDYHDAVLSWELCFKLYDVFSNEAKDNNQKDYEHFRKMSLFCKGFELLVIGDKFFKDGKLERNSKIDRSSEISIAWGAEHLKSAYKHFNARVIDWDVEFHGRYKTDPYFRFYMALDCFKFADGYFQELGLDVGVQKACRLYNYILTKVPFLKISPIKPILRQTEQEKRFMCRKNLASADKMFLLSLNGDAYNSAVEKYLLNPRSEEPSNVELAPLRLEESPCDVPELPTSSSGAQKRKNPSDVELAPLRLKDHSELAAKKPRLNEQTNSSAPIAPIGGIRPLAPSAPIAPIGGIRPLAPSAPIAPIGVIRPLAPSAPTASGRGRKPSTPSAPTASGRGRKPSTPSAPTASKRGRKPSTPSAPAVPMGELRPSNPSASTVPTGGLSPLAPSAPTVSIGGLRPGSPSDPITLIEESESGTRSDSLPVTEDAETRSNLNCLKWFQDIYDKLKQV